MSSVTTFIRLVTVATYLFGAARLSGVAGQQPTADHRPGRSDSAKPAWHGRPASAPPETEVVPPPPAVPPPAKSLILGPQPRGSASGVRASVKPTSHLEVQEAQPLGARIPKPEARTPNPGLQTPDSEPRPADPEDLRIREELRRLRDDSEARRDFYEDLRRAVERVRSGFRDEDSDRGSASGVRDLGSGVRGSPELTSPPETQTPIPQSGLLPSRKPSPETRIPILDEPSRISNPEPRTPALGRIDRPAYRRVVRWAKANDAPVPLALGVAWIESRLTTDPPNGAAGEVGMFQILPARCRIEGWAPRRLKEPEFNAWLGTRLLATYYRQGGTWARAAAQYVAGPEVFQKTYSQQVWNYINWYASSVNSYAAYFSRYSS